MRGDRVGVWAGALLMLAMGFFAGIVAGDRLISKTAVAQGPTPGATTIDVPAVYPEELRAQAALSPEEQMVALFNQERASRGLPPLVINSHLTQAAVGHSQDMAEHNFCGHQGSNGNSPWERIPAAGYLGSLGGENVACGQTTVQQAFNDWKASPGHYAIIMGAYGEVGLGWVTKTGTNYVNFWTADFGGSPGRTTPGSNPGPILTATPLPTVTPVKTPTPVFFPPTATPLTSFNGYQVIIWCDQFMSNCQVISTSRR